MWANAGEGVGERLNGSEFVGDIIGEFEGGCAGIGVGIPRALANFASFKGGSGNFGGPHADGADGWIGDEEDEYVREFGTDMTTGRAWFERYRRDYPTGLCTENVVRGNSIRCVLVPGTNISKTHNMNAPNTPSEYRLSQAGCGPSCVLAGR